MTECTSAGRQMIEVLRVPNTPDESWTESCTEWFRNLPRVARYHRRRPIAALTAIDMTAAEHDLLAAARCWSASLTVEIADTLTKVVEAAEDQEDAP